MKKIIYAAIMIIFLILGAFVISEAAMPDFLIWDRVNNREVTEPQYELSGSINIGGMWNDRTNNEIINVDGLLSIRKAEFETIVEYYLLKNQSCKGDKCQYSLDSELSLQLNMLGLITKDGYGFFSGRQERHRDEAKDYDETYLGIGGGLKKKDLAGRLEEYSAQAGVFARSIYSDKPEREGLLIPEGMIKYRLFDNLYFIDQAEAILNLNRADDWQGRNVAKLQSKIGEHGRYGVSYITEYDNRLDDQKAENILMINGGVEF